MITAISIDNPHYISIHTDQWYKNIYTHTVKSIDTIWHWLTIDTITSISINYTDWKSETFTVSDPQV